MARNGLAGLHWPKWTAVNLILLAALAGGRAQADDVVVSHYAEEMYGAPWAVALDQGYFKQYGAPITGISGSDGGGTTIRNMLAGSLPYTETAFAAAITAIHDGIDLKIVDGAVNNAADFAWVVLPNSPLKTIHDLPGHKLAYTRARSTSELFSAQALQAVGIDPSKVDRLALGTTGGGLTALDHGAVDTALELEPIYSRNAGKYRLLFNIADVLPPAVQHVGVVGTKFLKEHPDQVKAIIQARRAGVIFIKQHPDEAAKIVADAYDMPLAPIKSAMARLEAAGYWSEGSFNYAGMDNAVAGLHTMGAYPDVKADWSKIVDESALPDDLKRAR